MFVPQRRHANVEHWPFIRKVNGSILTFGISPSLNHPIGVLNRHGAGCRSNPGIRHTHSRTAGLVIGVCVSSHDYDRLEASDNGLAPV